MACIKSERNRGGETKEERNYEQPHLTRSRVIEEYAGRKKRG